jgi:hypothetical protein
MRLRLIGSALLALAGSLHAQSSDADYLATVARAAPSDIVKNATIVRMNEANTQTIQN